MEEGWLVKSTIIVSGITVLFIGCYYSAFKNSKPATVFVWSWIFLLFISVNFHFYNFDIYIVPLVILCLFAYAFFGFKVLKERELEQAHKNTRLLLANHDDKVDEERKRISRILHDAVNQKLIVSKLHLQQLRDQLNESTHLQVVDTLLSLNEEIYSDSRQVINITRTELLLSLGLIDAIYELIAAYNSLDTIEYEFIHDDIQLQSKMATTIYAIVREALLNIIKHAGATHVTITLKEKKKKMYFLSVSDNGHGIQSPQTPIGIGLIDMQERADRLKARLEIDSSSVGTTVSLLFQSN